MEIFASPHCSRYYAVRNNWIVRITSRIVQLRYGTKREKLITLAWQIMAVTVWRPVYLLISPRKYSPYIERHAATVFYEIARLWAVSVNYIAGSEALLNCPVAFSMRCSCVSRPIRTRGETPKFFACVLRLLVSIKKSKNCTTQRGLIRINSPIISHRDRFEVAKLFNCLPLLLLFFTNCDFGRNQSNELDFH